MATMRTVFISNSQEDKDVAQKLRASLVENGISVIIDSSAPVGDDIQQFIEDSVKKADVTLSIVSNKSLESAWVALASVTSFWREKFERGSRRIIACFLDPDFFADGFSLQLISRIDQKIAQLENLIGQHRNLKVDPSHLHSQKTRLYDLRKDLSWILQRFRDSLTLDIREESYDQSLKRIIETIKTSPDAPESRFEDLFNRQIASTSMVIDHRFVRLTMLVDKGENAQTRWERQTRGDERETFDDLLKLLEDRGQDKALVLLGAPGSGKTTLLKRLEVDYYRESVRSGRSTIPFFVRLSQYASEKYSPREWLIAEWTKKYGGIGLSLQQLLDHGRAILLLDALNEMPHRDSKDYGKLIDQWHNFAVEVTEKGNRLLISCRSLNYSQPISRSDLRVPQIEIQPLTPEKIQEFLTVYLPERHLETWQTIQRNGTADFYQTPYFLSLLCQLVKRDGKVPTGRATLFTAYVRQAMERELKNPLLIEKDLLNENDRLKITRSEWESPFQLPNGGGLSGSLSDLAYAMQLNDMVENKQVSLAESEALSLIGHSRSIDVLEAGVALNLLDKDVGGDEPIYRFQHQLLQEYFAGRRLVVSPNAQLVQVPWRVSEVQPTLAEILARLTPSERLPPLDPTGWEETTLTAVPMANKPLIFIEDLMEQNLPLAARCAISPEVGAPEEFKERIRWKLVERTQEKKADLRARIAAGEALGLIGDPRFKRQQSSLGEYLFPPLVEISAGSYPIGAYFSGRKEEFPRHRVLLQPFQIGVFPVTNAEYARFIDADGYLDDRWWDTPGARRWLQEGGAEGQRQALRDERLRLQSVSEDSIRSLVKSNRATPEQVDGLILARNLSEAEFERLLGERYPVGSPYRQPEYWDDTLFNNPQQPVVGVCWYEARAYCCWLSQAAGAEFRLPTEVEYEAAARGKWGRRYSYGRRFDSARCNTFESHLRRPTPVGVFDNRTPEGAYDLTGNVWSWTSTIFDQDRFPYPWRRDQREDPGDAGSRRLVRGGSWGFNHDVARAAYRNSSLPAFRDGNIGFRVVCGVRPPSLKS